MRRRASRLWGALRPRGSWAAAWRRAPLWSRLVLCALALAAMGLSVTGVVGVDLFRTYLVDQNGQELVTFAHEIANTHEVKSTNPPSLVCGDVPNNNAVELLSDTNGVFSVDSSCGATLNGSTFAVSLPPKQTLTEAVASGQAVTDIEWQVVIVPVRFRDYPTVTGAPPTPPVKLKPSVGTAARTEAPAAQQRGVAVDYIMVASPLVNVQSTVSHLVDLDVAVDSAVLLALFGFGYVLVRRTLLPLRRIESAATAISAGDLTRRIPHAHPKTEIGRLSLSLNSMLGQIETAFGAQARSEAGALRSEANMRQFAADASHELRTPLASIRGITELYRQGAADSRQLPDLMRRIEDEASRMGLLVEDLLLLARLDQQRPLARDHIHLVALAADAIIAARARTADRAIDLRTGPPGAADAPGAAGGETGRGREPIVIGDESRLRQALDNLLTNAVRHTPAGTPITVRVRPAEEPGHHLLEVIDTGPGLSAEDAAHVFERFYRADPSRARTATHQGSGLGLTIVAAIAQAHGGSVSVRSEPGHGACFALSLPDAPGVGEV